MFYNYYIPPVASAPFLTSLEQISATAVRVEWSQPSEGATVTGYIVHYSDGDTNRTDNVAASANSSDITHLTSGLTYTISVEATSQHLSGESDEWTITLGEMYSLSTAPVDLSKATQHHLKALNSPLKLSLHRCYIGRTNPHVNHTVTLHPTQSTASLPTSMPGNSSCYMYLCYRVYK